MNKTKLNADGSLDRLKAYLVSHGYSQMEWVDFQEIFNPIVRPQTIRLVIILTLHFA